MNKRTITVNDDRVPTFEVGVSAYSGLIVLDCNDQYLTMVSRTREEVLGQEPMLSSESFKNALHKLSLKQAVYSTTSYEFETEVEVSGAASRCYRVRSEISEGEDNSITLYFEEYERATQGSSLQNITEIEVDIDTEHVEKDVPIGGHNKRAERRKLMELAAMYNLDAVCIISADDNVEWVNDNFEYLTGYGLSELEGNVLREVLSGPETSLKALANLKEKSDEGVQITDEVILYNRQKEPYWAEVTVSAVYNARDEVDKKIIVHRNVSKRKQAEILSRQNQEKYELAISGCSEGIWDWEIGSNSMTYSNRIRSLLGYEEDEFPDVPISFLSAIHTDEQPLWASKIKNHLEKNEPYEITMRLRTKDGSYKWFLGSGQAMWDENGTPCRMAGGIVCIDEWVEARVKADHENKSKTEFLANMSHEIRTPLNGVLGMAQLLGKSGLNDKQQKYIDKIRVSGVSLLDLINDVLDTSKIESGLMKLEIEPFVVEEFVSDAVDTAGGIALQKGLSIEYEVDPKLDGKYLADYKRLRQVLVNFIGNAVKFTDEGGVKLCASLLDSGDMKFEVIDTGPGIPKDQLGLIFGRFSQADSEATRKHGGTGLGLSISKDFVELMNGEIGVDSELNVGSTFWFTVPLRKVDETEALTAA